MRTLLLLVVLALTTPVFTLAQTLKIMTYNIRFDNPRDGRNAWPNRKDRLIQLVREQTPDVLGVQEALHHQLTDMLAGLNDYAMVGVGRDDGKEKGEYSAILYRKSAFELRDQNTFWLSETPEVPGSKSWDAAITRVVTWARLYSKALGTEILAVNTHFDHIGKEARLRSAELIRKKIAELAGDLPVVVTGDFNFTRNDPPYQAMMKPGGYKLTDSAPSNPPGTFCGFEVGSQECVPIDYVFLSPHWQRTNYTILDKNNGRDYPSDHLPVVVSVRLDRR
ncbi:MAG TPA: endonuclease/exonuclease/phosphatase family protein [Cyclobacteriaceae bacterium]